MIVRLVKLTIREENLEEFVAFFSGMRHKIRSQKGCHELTLLEGETRNTLYTLSKWESEEHLNDYRSSELFRSFWPVVKLMFESQAEAQSFNILEEY